MDADPDTFVCPILGTLMADPVVAADGHTYERSAISEWYKSSDMSPLTGLPVESRALIPNHALRKTIDEYCVNRPDRIAQREASRKPHFAVATHAPTTTGAATTARGRVTPVGEIEKKPWEFDKKLLATASIREKRPVVLSASRTSLYSGEGVLVAFEPTKDGKEFTQVMAHPIKLDNKYTADASISCMERMTDEKFVVGTRDGSLAVWRIDRAADGKLNPIRIWKATTDLHSSETTCVGLVPLYDLLGTTSGDPLIATGSRDRTVKLWKASSDTRSYSCETQLDHRADVMCLAGLREGHVVSGGSDWSLKLWDPNIPNEPVRVLDSHSRTVRCVTVDNKHTTGEGHFASGSDDETIAIWDPRASDPIIAKIDASSPVLCLSWDGDYLCAGGGTAADSMTGSSSEYMGGWLRFYDPRTWKIVGDAIIPHGPLAKRTSSELDKFQRPRTAHEVATNCLEPISLAGNHAIISGGDDKALRIWISPPLADSPYIPRPTLAYETGGTKVFPIAVDCITTLFI